MLERRQEATRLVVHARTDELVRWQTSIGAQQELAQHSLIIVETVVSLCMCMCVCVCVCVCVCKCV